MGEELLRFHRSVYVAGAGRLGRAFAAELAASGIELRGTWNRTEEGAAQTGALTGAPAHHGPLPDPAGADVVVIAVADRFIAPLAAALLAAHRIGPEQVVLHCSGALPASILRIDISRPAAVAGFHPLQTFTASAAPPARYHVAVEGEEPGVRVATELAQALGHPVLRIRADRKALYHAAATVACNYLVTLEHTAADLMRRAGVPYRTALVAIGELAHATIDNLVTRGPVEALTGPIVRGDIAVVARHLDTMFDEAPDIVELYQILGRYTLALVNGTGRTVPGAAELRSLLLP